MAWHSESPRAQIMCSCETGPSWIWYKYLFLILGWHNRNTWFQHLLGLILYVSPCTWMCLCVFVRVYVNIKLMNIQSGWGINVNHEAGVRLHNSRKECGSELRSSLNALDLNHSWEGDRGAVLYLHAPSLPFCARPWSTCKLSKEPILSPSVK